MAVITFDNAQRTIRNDLPRSSILLKLCSFVLGYANFKSKISISTRVTLIELEFKGIKIVTNVRLKKM